MPKFQLDLIFDQTSGQVEFLIDLLDASRSAMDIHEGIEDGSLREEVLEHIEASWGADMANQVRSGAVGMRCTETSPQDRREVQALLQRHRQSEGPAEGQLEGQLEGQTQPQAEAQPLMQERLREQETGE